MPDGENSGVAGGSGATEMTSSVQLERITSQYWRWRLAHVAPSAGRDGAR